MDLIELLQDVVAALRPLRRVLLQALHDERGECRRCVRAQLTYPCRCLGQLRREDALQALAWKRRLAGEEFIRHAAERVDVGAMIDGGVACSGAM